MGQAADQIERHIYDKRHELGENIHELQHKVKNAVDWRVQMRERPWTMVGLAFGVGAAAALLMRGKRSFRSYRAGRYESRHRYGRSEAESESSQMWNNVKSAVAAVTISAARDFVSQVIPGFREEYRKRQGGERRLESSYGRRGGDAPSDESGWRTSASA